MNDLDEQTNGLLRQGLVKTPPGFRDGVMQEIASYERERQRVSATDADVADTSPDLSAPRVPWWQWVALTVGSVIGGGQVLRFIFSVWFVSSAAY